MKTFKEYVREQMQLSESPMRIGMDYGDILDNKGMNVEEAEIIRNTLPCIDSFVREPVKFDLYQEDRGDNKIKDFWTTPQPLIVCFYIFQLTGDGGVQSVGVWNDRTHPRRARILFFDYYLKKYNYIQSDNRHTTQGENFWKKLITEAQEKNHKVTVVSSKGNEYDIDDAEAYWGRSSEFSDYIIRIYG